MGKLGEADARAAGSQRAQLRGQRWQAALLQRQGGEGAGHAVPATIRQLVAIQHQLLQARQLAEGGRHPLQAAAFNLQAAQQWDGGGGSVQGRQAGSSAPSGTRQRARGEVGQPGQHAAPGETGQLRQLFPAADIVEGAGAQAEVLQG